ncbi:MAG: polysaccharide deacetylase family protein [Candidatus Eremiobacteraeota bacterium]|nr:polysaccharide deacetylase family protein [Candidatus Eremiobacteraeota bacterium]
MRALTSVAALAAALVLAGPAYAGPAVSAIFMYHHVCWKVAAGPYGRMLTVTPTEFAGQLAWLRRRGCRALSLDALARAHRSAAGGCRVALTFDDGYADAATIAVPLLERYRDGATFFVPTGYVGRSAHMTAAQLRALAVAGMEIGAHTVHHPDLTQLRGARLRAEVFTPKRILARIAGAPVTAFAYPSGRWDGQVREAVRAAGYDFAVTTMPGRTSDARGIQDRLLLPRFRVRRGGGIALFQKVLGKLGPAAADAAPAPVRFKNIARRRIEGNDPIAAEAIAAELLSRTYPEQILKVRVLKAAPLSVAGIMLSGVKFHRPVTAAAFLTDVRAMISEAFAVGPGLREVDLWAVVPLVTAVNSTVSGDYAVPTNRTVFSTAARRPLGDLGKAYWDPVWRRGLARERR